MSDTDVDSPLYASRPDWADVVPIAQYEGVNPIAPIFYTPEYRDATDYFRGIVKMGEMSQRALELTEAIIRMNPAHYSAWQYRYKTLIALDAPLHTELHRMDELAIRFLKTYQVWHHRRLLITALHAQAPSSAKFRTTVLDELAFIKIALSTDAKNYHTWSYRQWLLAFYDEDELWEDELGFVETLLQDDVRNNSAWHHRFFIVFGHGTTEPAGEQDAKGRQDVLKREVGYTKNKISLAPNNPSAWNYLRGVLEQTKTPFSDYTPFVELYTRSGVPMEDVVDLDNPVPSPEAELPCVAALEFLADIHERAGGEATEKAIEIWRSLANEHDTMRKKYWEYRIKEALAESNI